MKLPWASRERLPARISDDYGDGGYAQPFVYKLLVLKSAPEPSLPLSARQESEAEWFEARYSIPISDSQAWYVERMEYSFAVSAASSPSTSRVASA